MQKQPKLLGIFKWNVLEDLAQESIEVVDTNIKMTLCLCAFSVKWPHKSLYSVHYDCLYKINQIKSTL